MALTWNAIELGLSAGDPSIPTIDINERISGAENSSAINGLTFGDALSPVHSTLSVSQFTAPPGPPKTLLGTIFLLDKTTLTLP